MNRRSFVKLASGLLVAAGAGELIVPERRYWQLDGTMVPEQSFLTGNFDVDANMPSIAKVSVWTPVLGHEYVTIRNSGYPELARVIAYRDDFIRLLRTSGEAVAVQIDRPAIELYG